MHACSKHYAHFFTKIKEKNCINNILKAFPNVLYLLSLHKLKFLSLEHATILLFLSIMFTTDSNSAVKLYNKVKGNRLVVEVHKFLC